MSAFKERLVDEIRKREQLKRAKRFTRPVRIPSGMALIGLPSSCLDICFACRLRGSSEGGVTINEAELRELVRARGIAFKVLLTAYRYARVLTWWSPSPDGWDLYSNASARLSVGDLAAECITGVAHKNRLHGEFEAVSGLERRPNERAVRRAIDRLELLGLAEVIEDPGRPSILVPHQLSPYYVTLPQRLWRSGWLRYLDGTTLLLLVALLGATAAESELIRHRFKETARRGDPRGISENIDHLAERGKYVHGIDIVEQLPVSPQERRQALQHLLDCRLVAELERQGGRLLVLLDPELRSAAPASAPGTPRTAHSPGG